MTRGWRDALVYYPLLPLGALIGLVWANAAAPGYFRIAQALAFPVNDIGVAFGLAALAQEVLEAIGPGGTVPSWRHTLLAAAMGLGGAIGAVAFYATYIHLADEQLLAQGWPVVCGVDVFVGVAIARAIFRRGGAVSLVVILALVSDVVALLAISRVHVADRAHPAAAVLIAAALLVALLFRWVGVRSIWLYLLTAAPLSWLGFYRTGLHPALALLPLVPFFPRAGHALGDFAAHRHDHASVTHFESALAYPLQGVAFLFGLVNAGVLWRGVDTGTWAVVVASLIGRPLGILSIAAAAAFLGVRITAYLRWRELIVAAFIGSVGAVFALFVSTAVFPDGPLLTEAKLGAIATIAGVPLAYITARAMQVGRFVRREHA
jgi:Na+:H+ antiporter, NhaA family